MLASRHDIRRTYDRRALEERVMESIGGASFDDVYSLALLATYATTLYGMAWGHANPGKAKALAAGAVATTVGGAAITAHSIVQVVKSAVNRLSPSQRQTFITDYFQGLKVAGVIVDRYGKVFLRKPLCLPVKDMINNGQYSKEPLLPSFIGVRSKRPRSDIPILRSPPSEVVGDVEIIPGRGKNPGSDIVQPSAKRPKVDRSDYDRRAAMEKFKYPKPLGEGIAQGVSSWLTVFTQVVPWFL